MDDRAASLSPDPATEPDDAAAPPRAEEPPRAKSLGPLRMVWREAAKYPAQIAIAFLALVVTSTAMLAFPAGLKLVVDRGFAEGGDPTDIGRWFRYLLVIVGVLVITVAASLLSRRAKAQTAVANARRHAIAYLDSDGSRDAGQRARIFAQLLHEQDQLLDLDPQLARDEPDLMELLERVGAEHAQAVR